jgi:hypothetical protein
LLLSGLACIPQLPALVLVHLLSECALRWCGVRYGALAVESCGAGPKGARWWCREGNQPFLSGGGGGALLST